MDQLITSDSHKLGIRVKNIYVHYTSSQLLIETIPFPYVGFKPLRCEQKLAKKRGRDIYSTHNFEMHYI